jgi:hypothetical protein
MGKKWDYNVPDVEVWKECLRVLKPGGHLLSFAGSRTYHRMAVNIEDAGFEIRDQIMWIYGSGFPKSMNIGKAIDKLHGNKRDIIGVKNYRPGWHKNHTQNDDSWVGAEDEGGNITRGNSKFEGWGTALKPAHEPIVVARKPFSGTVAQNVLENGAGAINIDGCRVPLGTEKCPSGSAKRVYAANQYTTEKIYGGNKITPKDGRFPANVIHDGSDEVVNLFPDRKSGGKVRGTEQSRTGQNGIYGQWGRVENKPFFDSGSASRFFYCAKASRSERGEGNNHPTVSLLL